MRENPKPQEIYKHFKGNLYQIITLAKHSETEEIVVIYQALYGDFAVYVRELSNFLSVTDKEKYPEAEQIYRFEKVTLGKHEVFGERKALTEHEVSGEKKALAEHEVSGEKKVLTEHEVFGDKPDLETDMDTEKEEAAEELNIDPLVMEFLDADSYEERLNILAALHSRITNEMINTMAVAADLEIEQGDVEERFQALKNCLLTLEKYECNRLR